MKNYFQVCSRFGKRTNPKVPEIRICQKFCTKKLVKMSDTFLSLF